MAKDRDYHNKGQADRSKNKYDPPHSRVEDLVRQIVAGESKSERRDRKSYDQGRKNNKRQKGGCFLTTACIQRAGLADDCRELQVLRQFRDDYVQAHPSGDLILAEYYRKAPAILRRIQESPECGEVFDAIFGDIREAVRFIEIGHHGSALEIYAALFLKLQARYEEAA